MVQTFDTGTTVDMYPFLVSCNINVMFKFTAALHAHFGVIPGPSGSTAGMLIGSRAGLV